MNAFDARLSFDRTLRRLPIVICSTTISPPFSVLSFPERQMTRRMLLIVAAIALVTVGLGARQGGDRLTADVLKGLELRSIGPALTTGRIVDVKIDPKNPSVWY